MFAAGLMLGERPLYRVFINASRTTPWVLTTDAPTVMTSAPVLLQLTVSAGVQVQSDTTATAALVLAGLAAGSEILLTNLGYVMGFGGAGGAGGTSIVAATAGSAGGPAILGPGSGRILRIANASGRIWGGGGGGGGGGVNYLYFGDPVFSYIEGDSGGGGGGAGSGAGGAPGNSGGTGGTATGGALGAAGAAGASTNGIAGNGGAGGAYGVAGSAGVAGAYYGGGGSDGAAGGSAASGGAAGAGITLNGASILYTSVGDIRGSVA